MLAGDLERGKLSGSQTKTCGGLNKPANTEGTGLFPCTWLWVESNCLAFWLQSWVNWVVRLARQTAAALGAAAPAFLLSPSCQGCGMEPKGWHRPRPPEERGGCLLLTP